MVKRMDSKGTELEKAFQTLSELVNSGIREIPFDPELDALRTKYEQEIGDTSQPQIVRTEANRHLAAILVKHVDTEPVKEYRQKIHKLLVKHFGLYLDPAKELA